MRREDIPQAFAGRRMRTVRALQKDALAGFTEAARTGGDRVRLEIGPYELLLISDPHDIEQVLVTQNRRFTKGRALQYTRRVLGRGLLTSEGDFWRRERRLIQPAFHRQRIHGMGQVMVDYASRAAQSWQDGAVYDAAAEMMRLTFSIAAATLFSAEVSRDADVVRETLTIAMRHVNGRVRTLVRLPPWMPTPSNRRFERAATRLDQVVHGIIRARRQAGGGGGDLLALLMAATDTDGSHLSDQQLRDEIMTLLLAGHETTANLLAWTWLLVDQNPAARDALEREWDTVLGERPVSADDYPALPYTNAVVSEVLRLYPPAWIIGRAAVEPFELPALTLPAGTQVLMSPWIVQRDRRRFADPDAFRPERWLDGSTRNLPPFAYFPFGGGPRLCIGKPMALLEATLVLATLGRAWRFHLVPGHPVATEPLITLRPRYGLQMRLERRPGGDLEEGRRLAWTTQ
jgi:cytochrome P450